MSSIKIAILYICTGKYSIFWEEFYKSAQKNLFPNSEKHFFIFSDASPELFSNEDTSYIYQKKLGWPNDTLQRFHMFSRILDELEKYDFIFFFNANTIFLEKINESILPTDDEGLLVVQHPGYYNSNVSMFPYEKNKNSTAYIGPTSGKYYIFGAVNGGTRQAYIMMIKTLTQAIDTDTNHGLIAIWHDESHINKYIIDKKYKLLSPEYAYPENGDLPFQKKILILDKNKFGGHDFLRGTSSKNISYVKKIIRKILKIFH